MSFQDVCHDLEAGLPLPPRPPPPPPPPQAVVAHCVFQINTKVSELRRLAHELGAGASAGGGGSDARVVRERIRRARADVTRLARNTARRLANPAAAAAVGPNLATDFQAALREFQWVQGRIIEADRQETAAADVSSSVAAAELRAGAADQQCNIQMQQQQQQQLVESRRTQELALLDNEITFNEALVEEREREICKIQQEIAEIFVDLGKLVHHQQGASMSSSPTWRRPPWRRARRKSSSPGPH
ncbi:syntaxin-22-like [Miscanthus floridulus]|uniref:syntaxin-22-like n=1 Tax=Miscanthus floridulus TaxID=154761 RepID=UPI00345A403C